MTTHEFGWRYRIRELTKIADGGNADAMYTLGVCHGMGMGVTQNYKKGVEWLRKAAELGSVKAMNSLVECYAHGVGVNKSEKEAFRWYRMAVSLGVI